jgi:hypothetical protein
VPEVSLQIVPELFQTNSGGGLAVRDQERNHLAEDAHLTPALCRPRDDAADDLHETRGVYLAIDHELRERLGGIECEVGVVIATGVEEPTRPQSLGYARPVLRGSNDERGTIRQDGISAKRRYRVEERCVGLIEPDDMLGCMHGDAVRTFRARPWNA